MPHDRPQADQARRDAANRRAWSHHSRCRMTSPKVEFADYTQKPGHSVQINTDLVLYANSDDERRKATRQVAAHAVDAADCLLILRALNLVSE